VPRERTITRVTTARERFNGYLAVMGAATLWGISGVVAKGLFNRQIAPWTLIEIRLTAGFVVLLALLLVRRARLAVPREHLSRLILLGLAMMSAQFTYYFTISVTNVATALFLQYTAPVFVALYGRAAQGESLGWLKGGAIALAVVGSYFLVTGGTGIRVHPLGIATGLLSAVAFGVYAILGRGRVRQVGSAASLLYALGTGAVFWSVIVPPWRAYLAGYSGEEWLLFTYIVIFGTILPFGLFLRGLRTISSSMASLTATLEPVVGATAAFLILGEVLAGAQIVGGLAIAAAVVLIQIADIGASQVEEPLPPAPN
jgi:drug/metabolite transporter (DMT)-like permease